MQTKSPRCKLCHQPYRLESVSGEHRTYIKVYTVVNGITGNELKLEGHPQCVLAALMKVKDGIAETEDALMSIGGF
jgi:hypothetical protein